MPGSKGVRAGWPRLAQARPQLAEVIASVEKMKKEAWVEFRDRHGDGGRDLGLYLGRRMCGLKLGELAQAGGLREYSAAAIAIKRFEAQLRQNKSAWAQVRIGACPFAAP